MHSKLTLRIDDQLIAQAKHYAADNGKSLSRVVGDYFRHLATPTATSVSRAEVPPLTKSLRGILRESSLDVADYQQYLEDKYR